MGVSCVSLDRQEPLAPCDSPRGPRRGKPRAAHRSWEGAILSVSWRSWCITITERLLCSWRPPLEAEGLMWHFWHLLCQRCPDLSPSVPCSPWIMGEGWQQRSSGSSLRWQEGVHKGWEWRPGLFHVPFPVEPTPAATNGGAAAQASPAGWGTRQCPQRDVLDTPESSQPCLPRPTTPEAIPRPAGRSRHPSGSSSPTESKANSLMLFFPI